MKLFILKQKRQTDATMRKEGFTLIEALVAILIFTSALIVFGTMLSRGLSSIRNARVELQAYLFAQEGIEAVHQIRDSNRNITGADWLSGVDQCDGPNGCKLATVFPSMTLVPCSELYCDADLIRDTGIYYDQAGAASAQTSLARSVIVEPNFGLQNEITVTSSVRWIDTSGRFRITTVSEIMQDW